MTRVLTSILRLIVGGDRKQDRALQGLYQNTSALNVSPQVGDYSLRGVQNPVNDFGALSGQCYSNQAVDGAKSGSLLKVNEGGVGRINNGFAAQGFGLAQINPHYFSQSYADQSRAIAQTSRFRRACAAFVKAWSA